MSDIYYTIKGSGSSQYKEKMSRFLSFALPVKNAEEAKALVKQYQNEYHDSRHVCWAYMIGADRKEWQLNDNGEPSGTAGKPILGQINSFNVTDVIIIVVRYFGGIKLGTSGLIAAYREAARLALEEAGIKEMHKMTRLSVSFPYISSEGIMRVAKGEEVEILERNFDNLCHLLIEFPEGKKE
ncbi:MAG: IMPACT family protein, partial [Muribaculaceae bacterium]|nr:IMPACT family protein [Muribaculaceae bacterium]